MLLDSDDLRPLDVAINVLVVALMGYWMIWATIEGEWGVKDSYIMPLAFAFSFVRLVFLFRQRRSK
jgi:hypothetical protein